MSYAPSQEQRNDHRRDLAKHEPRPGDRLTPAISEALEIAILVRTVKSPIAGAELIEQYGRTCAARGQMEGVQQAYERMDAALVKAVQS